MCNKNWMEQPRFPTKKFWNRLSLDFARKKINIFFSSKDAKILKSYYKQYSKQAHTILASSDEKKNSVFLSKKKCFLVLFVGKRIPFLHFLLQISVRSFVPQDKYFFMEKRMYLEIHPRELMLLYPTSLTTWLVLLTRVPLKQCSKWYDLHKIRNKLRS